MTKTRDLSDFLIEGGTDLPAGKPHIVPGVLYPGYNNKQIDGTTALAASTTGPAGSTVASSKYGTVQSDGRMYYYTDIKGSKPIKDPRIGGHFGSQRYIASSLQLLEQETATHGNNVYSVDGREWMRAVGVWVNANASYGNSLYVSNTNSGGSDFIEIVGYFSDANFKEYATSSHDKTVSVDGTVVGSNPNTSASASVGTPLVSRYVSAGSIINLALGQTLGIHTLKLASVNGDYLGSFYGFELIAQDTTSTANRSKIQIPAQNVVSFGKNFPISATADHYDPFSAKTDGSAWTSPTSGNNTANSAASWPTNIDTTNSLGLENWVNGSSYYRPYNGGRVVKYVDSTGTIKTAVTVMPPNARSIGDANNLSGGAEKGDDSAGNTSAAAPNDNFKPTFTDQTIATAQDLHEVAKTFHWREFGNGAANSAGGDGTGGNADETYADASMLWGSDNVAYVMDDGLTCLSGSGIAGGYNNTYGNFIDCGNSDYYFLTFIGTGISVKTMNWNQNASVFLNMAQNLHYGTHIYKVVRDSGGGMTFIVDGVTIKSGDNLDGKDLIEATFYQPKKPPIPEDAVVLADYMLMADFVKKTTDNIETLAKGVRKLSANTDCFYDGNATPTYRHAQMGWSSFNIDLYHANHASNVCRIPSFSINALQFPDAAASKYMDLKVNGSSVAQTNTGSNIGGFVTATSNVDLGMNVFSVEGTNQANTGNSHYEGWELATPIHTSHHYQSFETRFLHELVGGDRNMEQTNLVCSPDGKTWHEITRDTSYIGNCVLFARADGTYGGDADVNIVDEWRGSADGKNFYNKDCFAIAYDGMVCLKDGEYLLYKQTYSSSGGDRDWDVNQAAIARGYQVDGGSIFIATIAKLKRGDFVQSIGKQTANAHTNFLWIEKK